MSVVLAVHIRMKPENAEKFMKGLLENARGARKEPGCRQFEVLVDREDPMKLMLFEVYDDEAAFAAHQQQPHFKKYMAESVPLLASRQRQLLSRAEERR